MLVCCDINVSSLCYLMLLTSVLHIHVSVNVFNLIDRLTIDFFLSPVWRIFQPVSWQTWWSIINDSVSWCLCSSVRFIHYHIYSMMVLIWRTCLAAQEKKSKLPGVRIMRWKSKILVFCFYGCFSFTEMCFRISGSTSKTETSVESNKLVETILSFVSTSWIWMNNNNSIFTFWIKYNFLN